MKYITDKSENLILCLHCNAINQIDETRCKDCNANVYQRKPYSLALTWNYTLAAILFLIPANLLTMMITSSLGKDDSNNILQGILYFFHNGELAIGIIIFIASIMVPIIKVVSLIFLLLVAHFKIMPLRIFALKVYRVVKYIGKYSLVDVYVVAIMYAIVQYQSFAEVQIGGAAVTFATAVILTMFAIESFDPRIMFDKENDES